MTLAIVPPRGHAFVAAAAAIAVLGLSSQTARAAGPGDPCAAGETGIHPLCVAPIGGGSAGGTGPSGTCTAPGAFVVVDGTFGGTYLRLVVQQNGTSSVWVCVITPARRGRLVLTGPVAALPSADTASTACTTTTPNAAPGPHPLADGVLAGQRVRLDTWQSPSEVWLCVGLNAEQHRVKLAMPGAAPPTFQDD